MENLISRYPVKIYNSLSRQKESFTPLHPPRVGMYICGPTVYGDPHLGHARCAVIFDVVFRYLRHLKYHVRYVRNITDVGHLEDEVGESGEDKIAKKARLKKIEPMEVVQQYTVKYRQAMEALAVLPPSIEPSASGHISEQIRLVEQLLQNGFAYERNGSVYFDLHRYVKDHPYGDLSGKVVEDLLDGRRETVGQTDKKHGYDFALWKAAQPRHIMRWPSPWGEGFPGWHLECTAMSSKYLGIPFDIHGGGVDLQFPHHECEIAQAVGSHGVSPVKYWMHNNLLTLNGQKMSKSLGHFITLEELFQGHHPLLKKSYDPVIVRFFFLQAHYRNILDFSVQALDAAEKGFERLANAFRILDSLRYSEEKEVDMRQDDALNAICDSGYASMSDDFHTAKTLASLFDLATRINDFKTGRLPLSAIRRKTFQRLSDHYRTFFKDILGLTVTEQGEPSGRIDKIMRLVIEMRKMAREEKDYAQSDRIRDKLREGGIELKDHKDGSTTYSFY